MDWSRLRNEGGEVVRRTGVGQSASRPGDVDLLVAYSFLLLLEGNLRLFREFAANEIGRLQGISGEVKKPDPTGTRTQQPPA